MTKLTNTKNSTWAVVRSLPEAFGWRVYALLGYSLLAFVSTAIEVGIVALLVALVAESLDGVGGAAFDVPLIGVVQPSVEAIVGIGAVLVALRIAVEIVLNWLMAGVGTGYLVDRRAQIIDRYLRADWATKTTIETAQLQFGLVVLTTNTVRVLSVFGLAVRALVTLVVFIGAAFVINPVVSLALIATGMVLFVGLNPLSTIAKRATRSFSTFAQNHSRSVIETASLAREIHVFHVESTTKKRIDKFSEQAGKQLRYANFLQSTTPGIFQNLTFLLAFGVFGVFAATLTLDFQSLGVIVALMLRASSYAQNFQSSLHQLHASYAFVEQLNEFEAQLTEPTLRNGDQPLSRIDTIRFDDVSFAYVPDRPVLRNVTAEIRRGEMIGIVGPSGAGKSTLIALMLGLYRASEGHVRINGTPISEFRSADWAMRIGYVPQEPVLIDDTITANIRFFRDSNRIGMERIERAATHASVHETIASLPEGYDTKVGERGGQLSVGQRQRICIARALAGEPDLLILDEPTSALDALSEAAIQRALKSLHGEITMLIIAHRLSTLADCDRVMVFEDGRLVAFNTFAALRESNAFFQHVHQLTTVDVAPSEQ